MPQNKANQPAANTGRDVDQKAKQYLDHGAQSLVAMDNPDDSQLGADRTQAKDAKG